MHPSCARVALHPFRQCLLLSKMMTRLFILLKKPFSQNRNLTMIGMNTLGKKICLVKLENLLQNRPVPQKRELLFARCLLLLNPPKNWPNLFIMVSLIIGILLVFLYLLTGSIISIILFHHHLL